MLSLASQQVTSKEPTQYQKLLAGSNGRPKRCGYSPYNEARKALLAQVGVCIAAQKIRPLDDGAYFAYVLAETKRNRDPDNICAGAQKLVLDALTAKGIISTDGWRHVKGLQPFWTIRRKSWMLWLASSRRLDEAEVWELVARLT